MGRRSSHLLHRGVPACRIPHRDVIAGFHDAAGADHSHHAGAADLLAGPAVGLAIDEHHLQHAIADIADLLARIAETSERNQGGVAETKHRSDG